MGRRGPWAVRPARGNSNPDGSLAGGLPRGVQQHGHRRRGGRAHFSVGAAVLRAARQGRRSAARRRLRPRPGPRAVHRAPWQGVRPLDRRGGRSRPGAGEGPARRGPGRPPGDEERDPASRAPAARRRPPGGHVRLRQGEGQAPQPAEQAGAAGGRLEVDRGGAAEDREWDPRGAPGARSPGSRRPASG